MSKKEKIKKQKTEKEPKQHKSLKELLGQNKPVAALTAVAFVFNSLWEIIYVVCTMDRAAKFDRAQIQAQTLMMQTGQLSYTVSVDSPLYDILKYALLLIPVLSIVWAVCVYKGDKKEEICNKKLLITVFALFVVVCFTALVDIGRLHLIFT